MTLEVDLNKVTYTGNGVTTNFPFSFRVDDEGDLQVYILDTDTDTLTLLSDSEYTVAGVPGTGSVTYNPSGTPIPNTKRLTILRTVDLFQSMDIENQAGFFPSVLEEQLDHFAMQTQQLGEKLGRSLLLQLGASTPVANRYLLTDGAGNVKDGGSAADIADAAANATSALMARDAALAAQGAAEAAADRAEDAANSIDYITVADRTALKAVDSGAHSAAFLKDAQHTATFDSSDLSAEITAAAGDESLYVAPNSDPTGASGAWVLAADSGLYFKPRPVEAPALVRNVGDWMRTQRKLGDFGAVGTSDDSTTWQTAVDEMAGVDGGMLELPSGITTVQSAIDLDLTSVANYGSNTGMDIVGPGSGHCMVVVDHAGEFLNISNNNGIANTRLRGFKIRGSGSRAGIGMILDNCSYMVFEDVFFSNLEYGLQATDFFSSVFRNCQWNLNKYSLDIEGRTDLSSINALSFENCRLSNNYEYGMLAKNTALLRWMGGNCEGNGRLGSGATGSRFGMKFDTPNVNGNMPAAIIEGCWFERNAGTADIFLNNVDDDVLLIVQKNMFARADASLYTDYNVRVDATGTGNVTCLREGNTHAGYSPYTASASRTYYKIFETSTGNVVFRGRSLEADSTERATIRGGTTLADLILNGTGTAAFASGYNVASITDNGTGDFSITYKQPALLTGNKHTSAGFDGYSTVFSESTSAIRLRFFAATTTTLTDYAGVRVIITE